MAGSSPGSEWSPFLLKGGLSRKAENETQTNLLEVTKCIVKNENSFLANPEDDDFQSALSVVLTDFLIRSASQRNLTLSGIIVKTCKIIMPNLLGSLKRATDHYTSGSSSLGVVHPNHILLSLKALCSGVVELNDTDFEQLENYLKDSDIFKDSGTPLPEGLKKNRPDLNSALLEQFVSLIPGTMFEKSLSTQLRSEIEFTGSPRKENYTQNLSMVCSQSIANLCRLDASDTIINFCMSLPHLAVFIEKWLSTADGSGLTLPWSLSEAQVLKLGIIHLRDDILMAKKALSLPLLEPCLTSERLRNLTTLAMGCLTAGLSVATAHSLLTIAFPAPSKSSGNNSSTACGSNIATTKATACPGPSVTNTSRDESEWESCAITVVEAAVEIYQTLAELIRSSPRSGRTCYDNFLYLAAWLILSGLQAQMICTSQAGVVDKGSKEDKGKSPSKHKDSVRINLTKVQQGFGGLSVVLASQALGTLEKLLEPNSSDADDEIEDNSILPPAGFNVMENYTHAQRMSRLLTDLPLTQMLFHIATVSYRKSCNLKRIQKSGTGGDGETVSLSDSATYYDDDDDFSCSEESSAAVVAGTAAPVDDDDDDSEPILGHWFEETITPPEPKDGSKTGKNGAGHGGSEDGRGLAKAGQRNTDISLSVPDKGEPHGFIVLAAQVFAFMNDRLLWSTRLRSYTSASLSEHQLALLAAIIRDLDRETARTETGTIAACFGLSLGHLYSRFSHALSRYVHNLLAGQLLSSTLQVALLDYLNVNPWSEQEGDEWPLMVHPRSLTVLAQVLLAKQRRENGSSTGGGKESSEAACLAVWKRLLDTMIRHIENPNGGGASDKEKDREADDLNVEHAQLLLFLFHSLPLMQKKAVLLLCAQTLVRAAQAAFSIVPLQDVQLMLLARILLLLEYLVKNLYDAPATMLEQIQWNLLGSHTSDSSSGQSIQPSVTRMYHCCRELEDSYRKYGLDELDGWSVRPRFYLLSGQDGPASGGNNQELPKLDGLACSFLLAPSDTFKYSAFYSAVLNVLHVLHQCEFHSVRKDKRDYSALCAVQYCFSAGWRLIQCLPPSNAVMENLSTSSSSGSPLSGATSEITLEPSALLHALLWGPRSAHKVYNAWITDCLVKQGLTTQRAIFVVKAAAKNANSTTFLVRVAKQLGHGMRQSSRLKDMAAVPDLWDVLVMDMVIARLRLLYDECANKDNGDESYRVLDSPTEKLPKTCKIAKEMFMELCDLVDSVANLSRRCVLHDALGNSTDTPPTPSAEGSSEAEALQHLLAISSTRGCKLANITPALSLCLPPFLRAALERWNGSGSHFPSFSSGRMSGTGPSADLIPSESYLNGILNAHLQLLSSQQTFSPASSLRHLLDAAVRLANDLVVWYPNAEEAEKELVGVFFPIALDACFENLVDLVQLVMERLVGSADSDRYQDIASYIVVSHCHSLVTSCGGPIVRCLDERALEECIRFLESCIDGPLTRHPLSRFYTFEDEVHSLWDIIFSTTAPELSTAYMKSVYRFVNKLLIQSAENNDTDLDNLCLTLLNLERVDEDRLEAWIELAVLRHLMDGPEDRDALKPQHLVVGSSGTSVVARLADAEIDGDIEDNKNSGPATTPTGPNSLEVKSVDGISLLQNLTEFAMRRGPAEDFARTLLRMLLKQLSPSGRACVTPDLVVIMVKLASVGQGSGQRDLFLATLDWLVKYQQMVATESWTSLSHEDLTSPPPELASFCCLLQYATDVLQALKSLGSNSSGATAANSVSGCDATLLPPPPPVLELGTECGGASAAVAVTAAGEVEDWAEELGLDDVESDGDESDEDMLCNKLCTYVITQKEFMNQHWYHCHTCRMVDGVGVCSVCAKVCHRDHDVTYAKFGSFFCDCGAKEDGSCQALVRRPPQQSTYESETSSSSNQYQQHRNISSSSYGPYRADSAPSWDGQDGTGRAGSSEEITELSENGEKKRRLLSLSQQLEPFADELLHVLSTSELAAAVVDVLDALLPAIERASRRLSPVGSLQRARRTLERLHYHQPKIVNADEPLMIPTLGSQEGAFENVRMSFTGDQGQTIRQLLSAHVLRRVSMCCLSSLYGRRQHLAMSHEKGKVTVLQLSSLLKQADASKRKLTLTRLSSAPVPFTVLSMAANPANEDVLAVCGLKEVHVMTLAPSGSVLEHLALHPQLETGNFVIKAVWLPGQATQLAVITADFVKIYDLSVDVLSPQYFFLLPSGKVRDCSFWFRPDGGAQFTFFISSSGYIYWQPLNAESSARHGPFYVTNILDVSHPEIKDGANGQTGGGGVSVYFSHSMQLLCFSYAQGKTFVASVGEDSRSELQLGPLHPIYIPTKSGSTSSSGGSLKLTTSGSSTPVMGPQQPLCQWAEVPGHPGLLLTLTQSSYTPVIIMIEPERILVEEIKVVPAKVKVTDMVAIRHVVNSGDSRDKTEQRTTLILLCDDGSLRIFMASPDASSYWLSPTLQPASLTASLSGLIAPKLARRQESLATGLPGSNRQPERSSGVSVANGSPTFPTDFFESCSVLNDVEFGGPDFLHVYNAAQLKHRLNTNGLYVACTKQTGFCMDITNTDPASTVMVGVRILVGSQDVQKAPSFLELFGRNVPLVTQRHRWFDIPLTKEESLQADKKLVLMFGSSNDPLGVTMIDSIKIYGKTKENFGWPEDVDDQLLLDGATAASDGQQNQIPVTAENSQKHSSGKLLVQSAAQITLDRLVGGAVALLEGSVSLARPAVRLQQVLDLSTHILTLSWSGASCVPNCVKDLLASLHPSREAYHDYKDRVLLLAVLDDLKAIQDETSPIYLDPEAFYNVLAVTRSIAASHSLNLIKFTKKPVEGEEPDSIDFVDELLSVGWRLHRERARNPLLSPVGQLGLSQIDFFVQATVDVLFAFALTEDESEQTRRMNQVLDHYLALLLCDDAGVSHAAKAALQRTIKNKTTKTIINKVPHLASTDEDDIMRLAIAMSLESGTDQVNTTEVTPLSRTTSTTNPRPLRNLRLTLLQRVTAELPELKRNGGLKSIHFLQVLLMLVSELRPSDPEERTVLQRALVSAVAQLDLEGRQAAQEVAGQRTPQHEVQLLVMKFFGFLLSTHKSRDRRLSRSRHSASSTSSSTMSPSLAMVAARVLLDAGLMERCLVLLQAILIHWKAAGSEDEVAVVAGLLKYPPVASTAYDLSPFFPRTATAGNKSTSGSGSAGVSQIFDGFSQLLTEMALRLPYLVKKVMPSVELDERWVECLCQYVSAPTPSAVKRHVRKLLLFHCGSKEKYRQVRDLLTLETHFDDVRKLAVEYGLDASLRNSSNSHQDGLLLVLPYDELVNVMEHLKVCLDVASTRTTNWQLFCKKHADTLPFLVKLACFIDEGVCCTLLQLLRYALCPLKSTSNTAGGSAVMNNQTDGSTVGSASSSTSELWDLNCSCTGADGCICGGFTQVLHTALERRLLSRFVFRFLLDCHVSAVRWHAHAILHSIFRHSNIQQQQDLVALMWSLWSGLQLYGRKAAQFVDLLGYLTITTPGLETSLPGYVDRAVTLLREENQLIVRHPNAVLYGALAGLVHLDGYYLERDPCLACSSPEIPFASVKLTALKADVRFTTSTQIVKLTSSHVVNRLALRISDIKRTKMVRTVNIYYNNRPVQAAVELKNRPGVWLKAKKLSLTPGQAEIKVDLPLPITCCNLKIEFAAFYENLNASSEMLQCPRCSASVPAHPGVCSNCGENVYQCHKCRSINYDEKDPFLCNACGFCKYAKFELTLSARPCCTVEPVENEEDRKKSLQNINTFLEKADRLQTQLAYSREALEVLVSKLGESAISGDVAGILTEEVTTPPGTVGTPAGSASTPAVASSSTGSVPTGHINRTIQHIAQRYHTECRTTFEELSKIAQRVAACRRDIVAYDAGQRQKAVKRSGGAIQAASATGDAVEGDAEATPFLPLPAGATCCYGCACGALDHCLTLLRAMATKPFLRRLMFERGLLHELLSFNVAQGSAESRGEVRDLLCLLTLNNADAVDCLNNKLMDSVDGVLTRRSGHSLALLNSVRHEMALLAASLQCQDTCWERRLRSVVQLFLKSTKHLDSPAVMDVITLPCLRVIQELIQNTTATSSNIPETKPGGQVQVLMDLKRWLQGDSQHSFDAWKSRVPSRYDMPVSGKPAEQVRHLHLAQKYAARWRDRCHQLRQQQQPVACQLSGANWLRAMLFNPNSRLSRQTACVFLEGLSRVPQRRQEIVNLLTSLLGQLGTAGPYGAEFFSLYMSLVRKDHWRYYLVVSRRLLPQLADWIETEIEGVTRQEAAGRSSELSQGHAMRWLVELLAYFLEESSIRQAFKGRLVAHVLNGYLGLRKLVLQRTRLIEETQELLLQLLGDMTTGTEAETRQFMSVCVNTLLKCHGDDLVTPVFVVERLCSIIHPEEKDDVEFLMSLDKDPQQEDFLQGRMQGNPYSSAEPGLGPLMRDIKNKICQDCELIALLEDDTGMELLVCNKIMSLDLPVRDVYRKVFLTESNEGEPMRVVYRMRGLLGDATEEFIERLDDKHQRPANDEETYRLASVMGECGGLGVMLERLSCVRDIEGEGRPLLGALVKLLSFCTKVQTNRALLVTPELNAVQRLLVALKLCLQAQQNMPPPFTEQLLEVMEAILCQASGQSVEDYARFSSTFGTKEDLDFLLQLSAQMAGSKTTTNILTRLTRVIPFLTFVNDVKMDVMIEHFRQSLEFSQYDTEHSSEQAIKLELFCALTSGIEHNAIGNTLKDRLVASKVVENALDYLRENAPPIRTAVARDSVEWKDFVAKPSLKFVLRLLTGLAHSHVTTQLALSVDAIPLFHHLEQISSDEHVGSLAENLLEAMRGHPEVAELIEEVRQQTKREKKRLAMAMRENQLRALGMKTNALGQVKAENPILQQLVDMGLGEEPGPVCVICREGYRFQPGRVLAIYTFSRRCQLEDLETQLWYGTAATSSSASSSSSGSSRGRKTLGYYTVSHFNVVHVECHLSAVRLARARDEWESAALQNANTRCNGLLPLWGPQVPESAFASCLARHNTYLQECTGHRDIGYVSTCHDLKLLLLRFALERSFSDESGGGGPQSNMHFLPYLMHAALYVLNTTRSWSREDKNLKAFLDTPRGEKWVESGIEAENAFYFSTLALLVMSNTRWNATRITFLGRLLVAAHCRAQQSSKGTSSTTSQRHEKQVLDYSVYKPALVFFGIINAVFNVVLKNVSVGDIDSDWPGTVAEYIRHNDEIVLRAINDKVLGAYQNDYLTSGSFDEFCDVAGLLEDIPSPEDFIRDLLQSIP